MKKLLKEQIDAIDQTFDLGMDITSNKCEFAKGKCESNETIKFGEYHLCQKHAKEVATRITLVGEAKKLNN